MSNLTKTIDQIKEEIIRVKTWCNQNNFDNLSAVNQIVRRYRKELKELLSILMQDSKDQNDEQDLFQLYFDDGATFQYRGFTYTLYKVPGDGWQWKNAEGRYALGQNFYFDGLLDAEQLASMAKHLPY